MLFLSSSSSDVDAESMGPSGCLLASLEGLELSRLPEDAGPHWARTALASSENEEELGLGKGNLSVEIFMIKAIRNAIAKVENRER